VVQVVRLPTTQTHGAGNRTHWRYTCPSPKGMWKRLICSYRKLSAWTKTPVRRPEPLSQCRTSSPTGPAANGPPVPLSVGRFFPVLHFFLILVPLRYSLKQLAATHSRAKASAVGRARHWTGGVEGCARIPRGSWPRSKPAIRPLDTGDGRRHGATAAATVRFAGCADRSEVRVADQATWPTTRRTVAEPTASTCGGGRSRLAAPEKADQATNRKKRAKDGQPVSHDAELCKESTP
jgi:hypothetical protein